MTLRVAVLDDYQRVAASLADWASLAGKAEVDFLHRHLGDEDAVAESLSAYDAVCLMRERTPFGRSLLARLPRLKLLLVTGAHNRTLDIAAATAAGVTVCHTRNASTEHPTAEMTWALILAALRRLPQENAALKAGAWQTGLGVTVHGRTLGILGLGRIGARVGAIGAAFGMNIIAWSQNLTGEAARANGALRVEKEELFARSDVLTLHTVLSERTRHIVGPGEIALMKPGAVLVNTSRGALVDEAALAQALAAGRIAGAGIDVFEHEPLPPEHPFRALDNVVLTPHIGYVTRETYEIFYPDVVENIEAFVGGRPIRVLSEGRH